jgi:hypothetical protein
MVLASDHAFGNFIAPSDNAPYRRDQLPIDVDTMKQLSQQLSLLCATLPTGDPAAQRTAAQFLALAQSLDPVNRQAENMREIFEKQHDSPVPPQTDVQLAKSRAWRTQSWLATEEAGHDGKILALCLGDVLAQVDPGHTSAANFRSEKGQWTDWVARKEDFEKKDVPATAVDEDPDEEMTDEKKTEDENLDQEASFALQTATVATPLMIYNEAAKRYDLKLTPVTMTHRIDSEQTEFRYDLSDVDEERIRPALRSINTRTLPWLKKTVGELPTGGVIVLSTPFKEAYSVRKNNDHLSAAAAVLAHAALTGQEPAGVVIGIVTSDGKLKLPKNGWQQIRSLSAAPPTRVVLPRSAAELLPSLLTMDELSFFMKHDIFLAENIDELIAFSKKTPDAAMAAALSNFAVVREKATSSIGPFVANPIVRARLEGIASAMPSYGSVQFLLMQARGRRPSQLSDLVVAHEIRLALSPLQQIAEMYQEENGEQNITSSSVLAAHESSRAILDPLDRLVPSSSRALYAQATDLSNTARTLARAIKKVADKNNEEGVKGFHDKSLQESSRALRRGLPEIERLVSQVIGDEVQDKNSDSEPK